MGQAHSTISTSSNRVALAAARYGCSGSPVRMMQACWPASKMRLATRTAFSSATELQSFVGELWVEWIVRHIEPRQGQLVVGDAAFNHEFVALVAIGELQWRRKFDEVAVLDLPGAPFQVLAVAPSPVWLILAHTQTRRRRSGTPPAVTPFETKTIAVMIAAATALVASLWWLATSV